MTEATGGGRPAAEKPTLASYLQSNVREYSILIALVVIMILMISRILDRIMSFGSDSTLGRLRLLGGSLL